MKVDLTAIADELSLDLRDQYTRTLALAFYWQDRASALTRRLVGDPSQSSPERHGKHETKGVDAAPQGEKE